MTDKHDEYIVTRYRPYYGSTMFDFNMLKVKSGLNYFKNKFKVYKFSDIKYYNKLFNENNSYYMRPLIIPNNTSIIIRDGCFETDKIILNNTKYCIYDPIIFSKFSFKVENNLVRRAIYNGRVDFLDFLIKTKELPAEFLTINYVGNTYNMFEIASETKCHTNVLEWCKNSDIPRTYSEYALDNASMRGNIRILDWWKNSGLELKYSQNVLLDASQYNNIEVLTWWFNSGLPLKYSTELLDYVFANANTKPEVFNCWVNSGISLPFKFKMHGYIKYITSFVK